MTERDCPHGRQNGKCADCDVVELQARIDALEAENEALRLDAARTSKALRIAVTSLRTIALNACDQKYFEDVSSVRAYAHARADIAFEAMQSTKAEGETP